LPNKADRGMGKLLGKEGENASALTVHSRIIPTIIARIYLKLIAYSCEIHWRFIAMCFHSPSRERGKEVRGYLV
jgi:hypothetical protein